MKPYETDDDIERALFALALEEPPADLRASILSATVYRAPVAVKGWEIWAIGALCAVLVWFLLLVTRGSGFPEFAAVQGYVNEALALFAQPKTLFWIAVGGAAAVWISQMNLTIVPEALRASRR